MSPRPAIARRPHPSRPLLVAALVLLGLLPGGMASASSASPGFDADEHARVCQCSTCRGASCCCGRKKSERHSAPTPTEKARPAATDLHPSPCLSSAPCDDAGLPTARSSGPVGKVASLVLPSCPGGPDAGRLLAARSGTSPPSRRPSRLERPPRMDAPA